MYRYSIVPYFLRQLINDTFPILIVYVYHTNCCVVYSPESSNLFLSFAGEHLGTCFEMCFHPNAFYLIYFQTVMNRVGLMLLKDYTCRVSRLRVDLK